MIERLVALEPGQRIVFGGDRVAIVDDAIASAFEPGDRLVVVQDTGDLLHVPGSEQAIVENAVANAAAGFADLATCSDDQITDFFAQFAALLANDESFAPVAAANQVDVATARSRDRSTTRLELSAAMRRDMIDGLAVWQYADAARDGVTDRIEHDGWHLEARRAPLGVVAFVFEGRPNVFADACGVLRSGNAVVFRIGSDALGTARAIVEHALRPALVSAGLPQGAVQLVDSAARSAGHALFSDQRVALAVARGSGSAVAQLGAVASQAGIPVSLHGTGGAWVVAGEAADPSKLRDAVEHSLDRKVCNTLNCLVVLEDRVGDLLPAALAGVAAAGTKRSATPRVHVVAGSEHHIPEGAAVASVVDEAVLATEWEWENDPELTLIVVDCVSRAVELCNRYSPHFVASMISDDEAEHERFYAAVDAPFVGNGFTRWVDGQYALDKPELGLSNWQSGRMLGRGGILSGDSVHTVRYRAHVTDTTTHR
ncbi:MAG: aldehyde dehydrogenase family protein [Ilumatobacter sp.]